MEFRQERRIRSFVEMIAAIGMHARAVHRMLRRAELDGDRIEARARDVPVRVATDGALRIR